MFRLEGENKTVKDDKLHLDLVRELSKLNSKFKEFGSVFEIVRLVADDRVDTAYITPYVQVGYNQAFMKKLNSTEQQAVLLHEVYHYVFGHFQRGHDLSKLYDINPVMLNIAQDIEINQKLTGLPAGTGVFPETHGFPKGLLAEQYYSLLMKMSQEQRSKAAEKHEKGMGNDLKSQKEANGEGDPDKEEGQGEGKLKQSGFKLSEEEVQYSKGVLDDMKERQEQMKNIGTESGSETEKLRKFTDAKVDLTQYVIAHRISMIQHHGFNYYDRNRFIRSRMDRRIIKFKTYDHIPELKTGVIIDTSRSRSGQQITNSVSLIYNLMNEDHQNLEVSNVFDLYFGDTEVKDYVRVKSIEDLPTKYSGRGGTELAYFKDFKDEYDLVVVLTDGYVDWNDFEKRTPDEYKKKVVVGVDRDEIEGFRSHWDRSNFKFPYFILG